MVRICKIMFVFILLVPAGNLVLNAQKSDTVEASHTPPEKEEKKATRKEAKKEIKQHFIFNVKTNYAFLQTQLRFTTPQGLLSFQMGLERNLGLEAQNWIVSADLVYRITHRSGLYGMYYGLKRKGTYTIKEDIIFPEDTIKAGSYIAPFFNTYVFSLGYLFSILDTKKSFLAVFFNVYMMDIKTGVKSDFLKRDLNYRFLAPLPNFGMVMDFKFSEWFHLYGGFGIFFVNNINGLHGSVYDIQVFANFQPAKWLGLSIGYQGFNVSVTSYVDDFKMNITYNFRGPSAGLSIKF